MQKQNSKFVIYVRNFIFGAEDSLVSTVGLLAGITVGGLSRVEIVLTGIVLIFVEAFSMGVGSYLSEYETEEYLEGSTFRSSYSLSAGIIMFVSYILTGLIPLWPYMVWDSDSALIVAVICSLVSLFGLGIISAKLLKIRVWRSALRMFIIGGIAILVGMVVGRVLS